MKAVVNILQDSAEVLLSAWNIFVDCLLIPFPTNREKGANNLRAAGIIECTRIN